MRRFLTLEERELLELRYNFGDDENLKNCDKETKTGTTCLLYAVLRLSDCSARKLET